MNSLVNQIKELVLSFVKDEKVKVILFGSRARGDHDATSDVDIGLIPYGKLDPVKLTLLKEKMENLNTPYKVDIVDFSEVSEEFKREAMKGAIVWKD